MLTDTYHENVRLSLECGRKTGGQPVTCSSQLVVRLLQRIILTAGLYLAGVLRFLTRGLSMNVLLRVLLGTGLFVFGYYLGREVGRGVALAEQMSTSDSDRSVARRVKSASRSS